MLEASLVFKNVETKAVSGIVADVIEAPDIIGACVNVNTPDIVSFAVFETLPAIDVVSVPISFTFDCKIVAISPNVSNVLGAELIRLLIAVLMLEVTNDSLAFNANSVVATACVK